MSYRNLEVWKLAKDLSIQIHHMSIAALPKFELFETGAQIRRSINSVRSNIVEGYGRRRYKQEFMKHVIYAQASCDETTDHLEFLLQTGSLSDTELFKSVHAQLDSLGRKLNRLIQAVESQHRSPK